MVEALPQAAIIAVVTSTNNETDFAVGEGDRAFLAGFLDAFQLQDFGVEFGDFFRLAGAQRDMIEPARLFPAVREITFADICLAFL